MGIFSSLLSPVTDIVGKVIDRTVTDKNQAVRLRHEIDLAIMSREDEIVKNATTIITAEAQGDWLQRNWRPITMLTFVALVVARWLGLSDHTVSEAVELELMALIKIGIGGYVVGRSAEKVAMIWKQK